MKIEPKNRPDENPLPGDVRSGDTQPQPGHLATLFEFEGPGRECWAGVDADEYVRELRAGWE
jgi:hypothetical protein